MRIERWDPADEETAEKTARACYDVMRGAHDVDEPVEPPPSYGVFRIWLRRGWEGNPGETWVARDADGTVAGFYRLDLPSLENLDEASGGPVVHPAARRRGLGRTLLRHAGERAAAHGRTRFSAQAVTGAAGDAFAQAVGARLDMDELRRIQYLRELAPDTFDTLRATAEKAAAGYSLESWIGEIPEEKLAPLAEVFNAYGDAPRGENAEAERWDAARLRERTGIFARAGLARDYHVAATDDATGDMVAYTGVTIEPWQPTWGYQQLTAVVRTHRGHRLGLLVKTEMLSLLAAREPQLERIATGNAAGNGHMIAVNEQLGYRLVEPGWRFYEMPVADMA